MKVFLYGSVSVVVVVFVVILVFVDGVFNDVVKIGVFGDMLGVYFIGFSGEGVVVVVKMVVEDFGGMVFGKKIEVILVDYQNKVDVVFVMVCQWIDQDYVDMIIDFINLVVGFVVQQFVFEKKVIIMNMGLVSVDFIGKVCMKYGIYYGYDINVFFIGMVLVVMKNGGDSWYFIIVDYVFGYVLQKVMIVVVEKMGGKVFGSFDVLFVLIDFLFYFLQVQFFGVKVVGFVNVGQDMVNVIKQVYEFGLIFVGQQFVGMFVMIVDVKVFGIDVVKGLNFMVGWYWNQDDVLCVWKEKYMKYFNGVVLIFIYVVDYLLIMVYLKVVKVVGMDDLDVVCVEFGKVKIDDFFVKGGQICVDGLLEYDMYFVQVQDVMKDLWDVVKVVQIIFGNQVYVLLKDGGCLLVK